MRYDRAIQLKGGRIQYSRRALPFKAPGGHGLLRPGNIAVGTLDMLPQLLAIQQRVAPWTRLYFAPETWSDGIGESYAQLYSPEVRGNYYRCNGFAYSHDGNDYSISSLQQPHLIARTVYHELFHNISPYLADWVHEVLDRAVSTGPQFPGEYANRPEERKARMFETLSSAIDEGLTVRYTANDAEHILGRIYSGEMAQEIIGKRPDLIAA